MYWVIAVSVLGVMLAALGADTSALSNDGVLLLTDSALFSPWVLIGSAFLMFIIRQVRVRSVTKVATAAKILSYLLQIILALWLVIGSTALALQQKNIATQNAITQTMRVQAWVRIVGISDSVYDAKAETGYRQVAEIQSVTPLSLQSTSKTNEPPTRELSKDSPRYRVLLQAYPNADDKPNDKSDALSVLNTLKPNERVFMQLRLMPLE